MYRCRKQICTKFQGEAQVLKVTICDIIGKTVFEKTITSSEKTLSALLPELNGIYFLSIYTTEGTST
ncbi:MAG: T9SS type A sorting domain-containing protein, partial [Bacteroidota bacterium]